MLHYAQSTMVVESLNKQVSLSSIVTVHVGKDFVTVGNIMCRVALIYDYHKTLQMFRYWNGEGGVRIVLFAQVVPVPYSVKCDFPYCCVSMHVHDKCLDSPSITRCKENQNTQVLKINKKFCEAALRQEETLKY